MSLGLQQAGVRVLCGVDIDPVASKTYVDSLGVPVFQEDIRAIAATELSRRVPKNAKLILGVCAPCQPFSKVRKAERRHKDRDLLRTVTRLVKLLEPAGILLENVPQITKGGGRSVLAEFCRALKEDGYSVAYRTINAKDYGVPQTRHRLVLLATRRKGKVVTFPAKRRGKVPTVRSAIGGLPAVEAGGRAPRRPLHRAATLSPKNLARMRVTPADGGDSRDWPGNLRLACHKRAGGFYDVYGRMKWDQPAPTLTTRCNSLSNGRFGHPKQDRAITLLEAALLQTFPPRHRFFGSQNDIARQIGNAVPPEMVRRLAHHLVAQL